MLVLAGPGSGKTKVLTERIRILIEEKNVNPSEILVITFSKKAAIEMRTRFIKTCGNKNYPVNFGTFHAVYFHILKAHLKLGDDCIIKEKEKLNYISDIGYRHGIKNAGYVSWQKEYLKYISDYKNHGKSFLYNNPNITSEDSERECFLKIYEQYVKRCEEEGKIDFDDILIKCRNLLYKHESILRIWQENFKYILVDEFQDINMLQYDVLRLLAGDRANIFAVGDDDQSIYAFRGAKPEIMSKFLHQYYNAKKVTLITNYRCAGNIVKASDALIRHNKNRIDRQMQKVFNNHDLGSVEIIKSESSLKQAEMVCEIINELILTKKVRYRDIAVLYRSGHCAKLFEMTGKKRGIPIDTKHEVVNLFDIKEVKTVISYMKAVFGTASRSDFLTIVNSPGLGVSRESMILDGDNYIEAMQRYYEGNNAMLLKINELQSDIMFLKNQPPMLILTYLLKKVGLKDHFYVNTSCSNNVDYNWVDAIDELKSICESFNTLGAFLEFLRLNDKKETDILMSEEVKKDAKGSRDSVNLMTAHASKGLEFKVVFIIGLQEGLFPHQKGLYGEALEEERRIMYVAMTRAKECLYLCSVGSEHGKQISRFVNELGDINT